MHVGIVAFQGDVLEHQEICQSLGVHVTEIRSSADLDASITHVILPGGESTVIARFLAETGVGEQLIKRAGDESLAIYGTCAGAILLAGEATGKNAPKTLGLLDITVDRNAYGTQRDSFEASLTISGIDHPVTSAFIRAPRITWIGQDVDVLASYKEEPVLVRSGRILAGTFHPEVRGDPSVHQFFLSL